MKEADDSKAVVFQGYLLELSPFPITSKHETFTKRSGNTRITQQKPLKKHYPPQKNKHLLKKQSLQKKKDKTHLCIKKTQTPSKKARKHVPRPSKGCFLKGLKYTKTQQKTPQPEGGSLFLPRKDVFLKAVSGGVFGLPEFAKAPPVQCLWLRGGEVPKKH